MDLIAIGILLPWLFVGLGCWLGFQLLRQNGRLLLRLEALEEQLAHANAAPRHPAAPAPPALPLGSEAPAFSLPDLEGKRRTLHDFRGQRLLLIFFNTRCGFCTRMAPGLAALPTDGANGRPLPLVVSTGDAEENRKLVAEHELRCPVLLQEGMEVASRYQVHGTPIGYLIDEAGHIASEIAVGAEALLALADSSAAAESAHAPHGHKGNRDLADSKLQRNGLPPGTPAPDFLLPALDGGQLSLAQLRSRRVLLVFSDPQCGPCNQLAPPLEQFHRRTGDVQVLMVSRGEVEANRAKAAEHGLTFPIVRQKAWEVSRDYALFATPIAYLIDEAGVIAAEAAVGLEPIHALMARAAAAGTASMHRCACGKGFGECGCARKNGKAGPRAPKEVARRR
jgi:peroxiredoxin